MKTLVLLILCCAMPALAQSFRGVQSIMTGPQADNPLDSSSGVDPAAGQQEAALGRDPYRIINGTTNRVTMAWSMFGGEVSQVVSGGMLVDGYFWDASGQAVYCKYFVANFPYQVADHETIPANSFYAWPSGTYTYNTVAGSSATVRKLDYGIVWTPPPPPPLTPEQIAARKARLEAEKKSAADKALKYNEDAAAKGDAYGLLRMGERYRDGDGVPKDLIKARDYLARASAAGSPSADDDLKQLASQ